MKWRRMVEWCRLVAVVSAVVAAGCATQGPTALPVCPGKANAGEALSALAAHAVKAVSLRINSGDCLLTYWPPDRDKQERHHVPIKLWFNPPSQVYIQGSIAMDAKAIIMGSNEEQFWLASRPKEMSAYYEGRWEEVRDVDGLMIGPKVVLEAFGIVTWDADSTEGGAWSLSNEGPFDILTRSNDAGRPTKKVYVYACDYRVHRIEYLDAQGNVVATTKLADYEPAAEGFAIPTRIEATIAGPDDREDSMEIDLYADSIKAAEFNVAQKDFMFTPRGKERAEHVYVYRDGQWVTER